MKRAISVIYDDSKPNKIMIGSHDGAGDPWNDLALLLEGVGVLTTACLNAGKTEYNGEPINEYLKKYIDKVYADFKSVLSLVE